MIAIAIAYPKRISPLSRPAHIDRVRRHLPALCTLALYPYRHRFLPFCTFAPNSPILFARWSWAMGYFGLTDEVKYWSVTCKRCAHVINFAHFDPKGHLYDTKT